MRRGLRDLPLSLREPPTASQRADVFRDDRAGFDKLGVQVLVERLVEHIADDNLSGFRFARQPRAKVERMDCYSAIEDEVGFQSCIREKETARELRQRVVI